MGLFGKKMCVKCGQPTKIRIGNYTILATLKSGEPIPQIQEQLLLRNFSLWKPTFKEGWICFKCYQRLEAEAEEQPFKQAQQQGKRQIIIKNLSTQIPTFTDIAQKFGYSLKQVENENDTSTMIFEKVTTTISETNFVNCKYCKTRYNANEYFKCPHCGSPTT